MILIHTALLCEAQTFIEHYKLKKTNSNPKIYLNNILIVVISGVGKENTNNALKYIFNNYKISKAFNIGIAGSSNKNDKIGQLFCTNHKLTDIKYKDLISGDTVTTIKESENIKTNCLYDMEGDYFLEYVLNKLSLDNICIFKIVSDYLENKILSKDYIKSLISNHKLIICKYIT